MNSNERRKKMAVQDFCNQMQQQLDSFEQQVGRIEKQLDAGGTEVKQEILPIVGDIKNLITELKVQKDRLETECPSDWSDEKSKMEGLVGQIGSSIDRAQKELPGGDVGG
jgi:hypothetical protein